MYDTIREAANVQTKNTSWTTRISYIYVFVQDVF